MPSTEPSEPARPSASPPDRWSRRLRRTDWVAGLLLVAVVVAVVIAISPGALTGSRTFSTVDVLTAFEPWRTFVDGQPTNSHITDPINAGLPKWDETLERLGDGDLPTWTTLVGTGIPLSMVLQRGTLSPINLPRYLLPAPVALGWVKLLEIAAAVLFTYLWCRRLGLARTAGILAGGAFAFTGFQIAWQGWQHTQVGALIPAVFWAVEYAVQRRGVRSTVPLALAAAAIILAGFPAVALWTVELAGVYALVRVVGGRRDWAGRSRQLAAMLGAVLVGTALTAVQLLPFLGFVSDRSTAYRVGNAGAHLPFEAIATMVVPEALGNVSEKVYYGPTNFIELQSYVGVGAVALALLGAVAGAAVLRHRRGATTFLVVAPLVLAGLVYVGGPPLEALAPIPPFGNNFAGRLRVHIGLFVAVLAGVGLHGLVGDGRIAERLRGWRLAALVTAATLVGALFTAALWQARVLAVAAGVWGYLARELAFAAPIVVAAGAGILLALVPRSAARGAAAVLLSGAVLVQGGAFAADYWAKPEAALYYPETPAHAFLAERLGHDRMVAAGRAMEPGTTETYGLGSVTVHSFQDPQLADLLTAADPEALRHATFPILAPGRDTATSPVFDRLGARFYVAADHEPIIGARTPPPPASGAVGLRPGDGLSVPAPRGLLRAVTVRVTDLAVTDAGDTDLSAAVRAPDGEVLATGWQRLDARTGTGELDLGLVWDDGEAGSPPVGSTVVLEVTGEGGVVHLAAADGDPAVGSVAPADDDLRLVYVGGVSIYARGKALPRVRWASEVVVEPDPEARVRLLSSGRLRPDQVVLNREGPPVEGRSANLSDIDSFGDDLRVTVDAEGSGLVVIADALTREWRATVDGQPAPILTAEHAGAAVPVPDGRHTVELVHDPPFLDWGATISLLALGVVVIVAARPRGDRRRVRRRQTRPRQGS